MSLLVPPSSPTLSIAELRLHGIRSDSAVIAFNDSYTEAVQNGVIRNKQAARKFLARYAELESASRNMNKRIGELHSADESEPQLKAPNHKSFDHQLDRLFLELKESVPQTIGVRSETVSNVKLQCISREDAHKIKFDELSSELSAAGVPELLVQRTRAEAALGSDCYGFYVHELRTVFILPDVVGELGSVVTPRALLTHELVHACQMTQYPMLDITRRQLVRRQFECVMRTEDTSVQQKEIAAELQSSLNALVSLLEEHALFFEYGGSDFCAHLKTGAFFNLSVSHLKPSLTCPEISQALESVFKKPYLADILFKPHGKIVLPNDATKGIEAMREACDFAKQYSTHGHPKLLLGFV